MKVINFHPSTTKIKGDKSSLFILILFVGDVDVLELNESFVFFVVVVVVFDEGVADFELNDQIVVDSNSKQISISLIAFPFSKSKKTNRSSSF